MSTDKQCEGCKHSYWCEGLRFQEAGVPSCYNIELERKEETVRPSIKIETEDWRLGCFLDWQPKQHFIQCPRCKGRGEVGGGFKSLDGPHQCPDCYGTRSISRGPTTPRPELPPALVEHMRRAWWDFFNKDK